jgi:hypothetical protein
MVLAALIACPSANAGSPRPIAIQFINRAADVPGLWDETVRASDECGGRPRDQELASWAFGRRQF